MKVSGQLQASAALIVGKQSVVLKVAYLEKAGDYEEYGFLGCNTVQFGKIPTFRYEISPLTSG
jgi:hypothetical protein